MSERTANEGVRWELTPEDDAYPPSLLDLDPTPPVLYGRGDPRVLCAPCLSVIGARRATPYGIAVAEMAGRVAAECGVVVVSGGALGCDSAAGRAALEAGGRTVVVSGCGADMARQTSTRGPSRRAVRLSPSSDGDRRRGAMPSQSGTR